MNPMDFMKNLGNLKGEVDKVQGELAEMRATGSSGGNMVNVTINGKFEMISIHLDPICVDNRDVPMLEDLIVAANHDAVDKMSAQIKTKLGPMVSGLNIPGLGL